MIRLDGWWDMFGACCSSSVKVFGFVEWLSGSRMSLEEVLWLEEAGGYCWRLLLQVVVLMQIPLDSAMDTLPAARHESC